MRDLHARVARTRMLLLVAMLSMVVTACAESEFVGCYKDGVTELTGR